MPRVLIAGDTHGNLDHLNDLLHWSKRHEGLDAIFQVGDFAFVWPRRGEKDHKRGLDRLSEWVTKRGVPFYFCEGNHDDYTWLREVGAWEADSLVTVAENVIYCPRGVTWEWGDVRCMAVGGGVSVDAEEDRAFNWPGRFDYARLAEMGLEPSKARYQVDLWPEERITDEQVERAIANGQEAGVDIIFSHDSPNNPTLESFLINGDFRLPYKLDDASKANRAQLDRIVDAVQPYYLFHGHYHHRYNGVRGRTQVIGISKDKTGVASHVVVDLHELVNEVAV